jgi:methionine synthase II (cobalamin-independent)
MQEITKDIEIEDLVELLPDSVTYLMEQGIRCLRCGEPIWGTLEQAAKEKGFNDDDIEKFVKELNDMLKNN